MKPWLGKKRRMLGTPLGSEADWRRRVATVAGGVLLGLAAIAFAELADLAQRLFRGYVTHIGSYVLVTTPAVFMLVGWMTRRWFSAAAGSGIPQVIAASRRSEEAATSPLVSLKTAAGKAVMTIAILLAGASAGREGPTVQLAAAINVAVHRWGRIAITPGC